MIARYPGRCARSGRPIKKGDVMYYDPKTRLAYAQETIEKTDPDNDDQAGKWAQEIQDHFFDNWARENL